VQTARRGTTSNGSLASAPIQRVQPLRRPGEERVGRRVVTERADVHRAHSGGYHAEWLTQPRVTPRGNAVVITNDASRF
jgi:hypothetical protein